MIAGSNPARCSKLQDGKYLVKKKVWIFGDSFSDPAYIGLGQFSWVTELTERYDVQNFSLRGTGPDWCLDLLLDQAEVARSTSDINLIFFVSSPLRFNFKFYADAKEQALFNYLLLGSPNDFSKDLTKPYLHFKKFIRNFYQWYLGHDLISFTDKEIIKYIGALKLHEKLFKKILVWPVFDVLQIDIEVSENFFLVRTPIAEIDSDSQFKKFGGDTRANHLSEQNHRIMLEQLSNWLDNGHSIDTSKFKDSQV